MLTQPQSLVDVMVWSLGMSCGCVQLCLCPAARLKQPKSKASCSRVCLSYPGLTCQLYHCKTIDGWSRRRTRLRSWQNVVERCEVEVLTLS